MASSDLMAPKLTVDDVFGFSDAELVQYMKQNRRDGGGFDLDFDGWENLAKEQRDQLAQRLKVGALQANEEPQSRPVDLDVVAARLREISDNKDALPQAASRSPRYERSPTPFEDVVGETKEAETRAYHKLVEDGGRPLYPISLLEEVMSNPEGHREMLLPWQDVVEPETLNLSMFCYQWMRWKAFRNWQKYNRDIYNIEEEFAAFAEERMRRKAESEANMSRSRRQDEGLAEKRYLEKLRVEFKRMQEEKDADDGEAGFSAFVEENKQKCLKYGWTWPGMTDDEYRQTLRVDFMREENWRFREYFLWLREDNGRGEFPEYVAEAKRRFAKHGFTRTFQFDKDPARQDKLTTWIEYLNYEYSWHDRYERTIERLRPEDDEAWKKLADSGVLRPGETAEILRLIESAFRRESDIEQARKEVASAEAVAKTAVLETEKAQTGRSRFTKQERMQKLAAAHSRLVAAKEVLQSINRRNDLISDFIRGTWGSSRAKKDLRLQRCLLQWVLEQVPLIEAELNEPKIAEGGSHAGRGGKRSRSHQDDQATDDWRPTKRKRGEPRALADDTGSFVQARRPPKRGHARPSKRLRNDSQDSASHDAMETSEIPKDPTPRAIETSQPQAISQQPMLENGVDADSKDLAGQTLLQAFRNRHGAVVQIRRSARIAARQGPLGTGIAHPRATGSARQRSRREASQERVPPSCARSRERQPRSPTTKTSRGRGTRGSIRLDTSMQKRVSKTGRASRIARQ